VDHSTFTCIDHKLLLSCTLALYEALVGDLKRGACYRSLFLPHCCFCHSTLTHTPIRKASRPSGDRHQAAASPMHVHDKYLLREAGSSITIKRRPISSVDSSQAAS